MFRKMRRTERELPERQAKEILENGSYGVLALAGSGGYHLCRAAQLCL